MFKKIIFTGFSPNIDRRDVKLALTFLLLPWNWRKITNGNNVQLAEESLAKYLNVEKSFMFDSGRTALFYALKSLGVGAGDKIFVQAFTCVVVINAIKKTGAQPVYVDIGNDFNINPKDLKLKVQTIKAKAIIIQHTFGVPAQLDKILNITKKANLKIIEDCAHSLGAKYKGVQTGTIGDIGVFSFGSDKIISCVRGGALVAKSKKNVKIIFQAQQKLQRPYLLRTGQHLMQIPIFAVGKFLYGIFIGKLLLYFSKKINLINKIVYPPEKRGCSLVEYPARLPNSLAKILCKQLKEIDILNEHRQKIAKEYDKKINSHKIIKTKYSKESVYLRYNILVDKPNKLRQSMKKKGIILGNWYNNVIDPGDIDMSMTGYKNGMCPQAERLAKQSVNLPTNRNITKQDRIYIIKMLNLYED